MIKICHQDKAENNENQHTHTHTTSLRASLSLSASPSCFSFFCEACKRFLQISIGYRHEEENAPPMPADTASANASWLADAIAHFALSTCPASKEENKKRRAEKRRELVSNSSKVSKLGRPVVKLGPRKSLDRQESRAPGRVAGGRRADGGVGARE